MKEERRILLLIAVIIIIVAVFSISVQDSTAQGNEILIGAEAGPTHIFNNGYFIKPNHVIFRDSSYFWPQMKRVGLDFQFGNYHDDLDSEYEELVKDLLTHEILRSDNRCPI